jgi:hypothetical protein
MQMKNSHAEFILGTYRAQLVDCAQWYPDLSKEFSRDYQRLSSAIDSHGLRFFLETMPMFRKHFDKCLSEQRLTPSNLLNFGVQKGGTIPRLFRGLILRVFDRNGTLKNQPDIEAIRWIRQLLGVVRKLRLVANVRDRGNTVVDFYQADVGVRRGDLNWDNHNVFEKEASKNATSFVGMLHPSTLPLTDLRKDQTSTSTRDLFKLLDTTQRVADLVTGSLGTFYPDEWSFRHGPGAVADKSFGEYKYSFDRWPDRLESVFPYADFAVANYAQVDLDSLGVLRNKDFLKESPARLCAVLKTIKTPRLIACEPSGYQWCQQAIRSFLYERVRKTILSEFMNFHEQDLNGSLALSASHSRSHSTIDLKNASDLISCWHVERLFRRSPSLLMALQASRSTEIIQEICKVTPKTWRLRKYSTMGNATTFPVQSLFFLVLALSSVIHVRKMKVSLRSIRIASRSQVRVFGDDMIVPNDASGVLLGLLEALELRVNHSKTFTEGNFRESCGVDAFDGHDVTTTNILDIPNAASPSSIVSIVDSHNNLLLAGYFATAAFLRKTANLLGFKKIREVKHGDGAFGWLTYGVPSFDGFAVRVSKRFHRLEIRCLQNFSATKRKPPEGSPGLLQFFTEAAKEVTNADSALGHLVQRPKTRLSLRWVAV